MPRAQYTQAQKVYTKHVHLWEVFLKKKQISKYPFGTFTPFNLGQKGGIMSFCAKKLIT